MIEYISFNSWKYCPKCEVNIGGVSGRHNYCCWCGTKLEDIHIKEEAEG